MKKITILGIIVAVLFLGACGARLFFIHQRNSQNIQQENNTPELISSVSYLCDSQKTIFARYYQKKQTAQVSTSTPGMPPVPLGMVELVLGDGQEMTLPQTISASGIRYANQDESFVFWSKGNSAFIMENNIQTYSGCIALSGDSALFLGAYADSEKGFSIRYPLGYLIDSSYKYTELGPGKEIQGVKFIIPASTTQGTNLSSFDTGISVEFIDGVQDCKADLFVYPSSAVSAQANDNNVDYSVATVNSAGAGNFYEEKVWAVSGSNPCTAVRYFIHYTNIGNYPEGTIKEFDRQNLLEQFNQIRRSLLLSGRF